MSFCGRVVNLLDFVVSFYFCHEVQSKWHYILYFMMAPNYHQIVLEPWDWILWTIQIIRPFFFFFKKSNNQTFFLIRSQIIKLGFDICWDNIEARILTKTKSYKYNVPDHVSLLNLVSIDCQVSTHKVWLNPLGWGALIGNF